MSITLSNRLKTIADFVDRGSALIDVGTDHGYIPVWLAENDICKALFASDIGEAPLNNAVRAAQCAGVSDKISFLLGAGLEKCRPDDVDTVIIAGMGGETICGILSDAPWTIEKTLILQPQTCQSELHTWLGENGFCVMDAAIASDNGKLYVIWKAAKGEMVTLSRLNGYVDPKLIANKDPLLGKYVDALIKKFSRQVEGLSLSSVSRDAALEGAKELLKELKMLKECL